jgi:hypothetical protein
MRDEALPLFPKDQMPQAPRAPQQNQGNQAQPTGQQQ